MFTRNYSWRRLVLALSILAVIATSAFLNLPQEVVSALLISFGMAVQYFFQQHANKPDQPA